MAGNMEVAIDKIVTSKAAVFILSGDPTPTMVSEPEHSHTSSESTARNLRPTGGGVDASQAVDTSTDLPTAPTLSSVNTGVPKAPDAQSKSGGLSPGAKIGLGVTIPLILILLGLGVFFVLRRKKRRDMMAAKDELGQDMIAVKNGHHLDEDQGSVPSGPGGTYMHSSSGSPPQAPNGQMYAPTATQESGAYDAGIVPSPAPVMTPVTARSPVDEEELMNRPVSPVHDDDLLTEEHTSHGSAGATAAGSLRERGSVGLDEDREMQWILEEERKAKERREQQGRLPTHGA